MGYDPKPIYPAESVSRAPMQKPKLQLTSLAFISLAALAGCSLSIPNLPGVYKLDIQQGNVITQDMIDQLRPGMTHQQVQFILGNPLIVDTFHPRRWDYLYSFQPGGEERKQERITLMFDEYDLLIGLAGDFMPGVSRDQEMLGTGQATVVTGPRSSTNEDDTLPQELPPAPGSLLEEIQDEIDEAEPAPVPVPDPL